MKGGGMKLHKFQIHRRKTGTGSHGNPVSRGNGWVGGVEVCLTGPSSGKQNNGSRYRDYPVPVGIEKIHPENTIIITFHFDPKFTSFLGSDQIDGEIVLEESNPLFGNVGKQCFLNCFSGDILNM